MRRGAPELLVAVVLAILLASYVVYTQRIVGELRREALRSSRMYARVFRAQSDTSEGAGTQALVDLSKSIVEQGVPLIVTDSAGRPTAQANGHRARIRASRRSAGSCAARTSTSCHRY